MSTKHPAIKQHNSTPEGSPGDVCPSAPQESYEWEETKAECGSSGVLLKASLLSICDITWEVSAAACMYGGHAQVSS